MNKKVYFNGLNEIRALAALAVLFHHIELYKFREGLPSLIPNPAWNYFVRHLGENGVFVFFTLSGFLITYLLFLEQKEFKKINVKQFYIRRILRIWPLYYIIVFIGFAIVPLIHYSFFDIFSKQAYYSARIEDISYGWNLVLHLTFLVTATYGAYLPVVASTHIWSVCVEEQFYLFWPWLVKIFRKYTLIMFSAVIIGMNLFNFYQKKIIWLRFENAMFQSLWNRFNIDFMAVGGILAWLLFHYPDKVKTIVKSKIFLVSSIFALLYVLFFFKGLEVIKAFVFATSIICAIEWKFSNRILNSLGKVSYGIYMYHPFMMFLGFALVATFDIKDKVIYNSVIYSCIVGGTLLASYFSFSFIENPLLKFKSKFALIKTNHEKIN